MDNLPAIKSMDEVLKLGETFEASGMFGCSQRGQGAVLVMTCLQSGLTPLEFLERYHLIDGRPSMRSDAMLARLLELGGSYQVIERSAETASINATYKEAQYGAKLTWKDAQIEPFTKGSDGKIKRNWATPRSRMQMLWARVVSDAVRTVCPLVCSGSYTPDEVADMPAPGRDHDPVVDAVLVTESDEGPVDYTVVPIGRLAGTAMKDLTDAQLEYIAAWDKVTPAHRAAAKLEIENRKGNDGKD